MAAITPPALSAIPTPASGNGCRRQPADQHILSLLDDHSALGAPELKQIHARILRLGLFDNTYTASRLLTAWAIPPSRNLHHALQVFDQMSHPNLYSWNILIRAHAASQPELSLRIFSGMLADSPHSPDRFTFPFILKSAAELVMFREGSALHGLVIKSPFHSDIFILNSLVHFYAACGYLDLARLVFDHIPQRDVVSWNSMIAALARADLCDDALDLFEAMNQHGVLPNDITMIGILSACGKKGDLELGRSMHSYIKLNRIPECLILDNAILHMYAKCGSSSDTRLLFDTMKEKDSISWATMVFAYAKSREFDAARTMFDEMPSPDIAAWNALISGYEQNGRPREALAAFQELQNTNTEPDQITLVAALSACSQLSAIESGESIHFYLKTTSFDMNRHLATALIDMYSKCGDLEKAIRVFRSVENRDVFVWSAMIAGLGMYGRGKEALNLFQEMLEAKVKPNHVTFTNILCACSHAGLIEEGRLYFSEMQSLYKIAPAIEHYGCMVDILGRAGRLEESLRLINSMPAPPPSSVWGALLGACAVHGDVELGELAGEKLLRLEPRNDGAYVLLSNLYARAGRWEDVGMLRKRMKDQGLKKEAGCSSMEVDGVVHEFLAGDASHLLSEKIYKKLGEMMARLKNAGYEPKKTQVLQNVEDEHSKERALNLHSEKLAIAFGLIKTDGAGLIRIQKNLRICEDCHAMAKLVSDVYEREILIRDRYRFHHFEGGRCSCGDYW
ncbi:Pentatricopeptide repeat-containing protein [Platanthera zijinensis]|uniref:Pentatricopeptide repeat-containing protein n=1 Tax=Platanthera zijinensis TaxID=2320716 RepID=A0AAP0FYB0_9ASPA